MSICAILRMKEEGWNPPGDIVLVIVCDEERGGTYGSRFLIEDHPDLFTGVRYAIGETGGFTFYINKQKFYPIMVAEKQFCILNVTLRGPAYYATAAVAQGSTAAKTGALLTRLDKGRLPVHVTPAVRQMIETVSVNMPLPAENDRLKLARVGVREGVEGGARRSPFITYDCLYSIYGPTLSRFTKGDHFSG